MSKDKLPPVIETCCKLTTASKGDSIILGSSTDSITWGASGYIIGLFVVLVSSLVFYRVPSISIIVGSTAFVTLVVLGLIFNDLGYGVLLSFLVVGYIISTMKSNSGVNSWVRN